MAGQGLLLSFTGDALPYPANNVKKIEVLQCWLAKPASTTSVATP
jgi:hypothetical protein